MHLGQVEIYAKASLRPKVEKWLSSQLYASGLTYGMVWHEGVELLTLGTRLALEEAASKNGEPRCDWLSHWLTLE
jgi:hypothetical protein